MVFKSLPSNNKLSWRIYLHPQLFPLALELESRYEITRSAASHPLDIALPTDNPPLWLPTRRKIIKIQGFNKKTSYMMKIQTNNWTISIRDQLAIKIQTTYMMKIHKKII